MDKAWKLLILTFSWGMVGLNSFSNVAEPDNVGSELRSKNSLHLIKIRQSLGGSIKIISACVSTFQVLMKVAGKHLRHLAIVGRCAVFQGSRFKRLLVLIVAFKNPHIEFSRQITHSSLLKSCVERATAKSQCLGWVGCDHQQFGK